MKLCLVGGCQGAGYSKDFCGKHYARFLRHGDATVTLHRHVRGTPAERLSAWSAVAADGCIEFSGKLRPDGYANFKVAGKNQLAHRVAYQLSKGPIPEDLEIRHLCDNRCCINPQHLEPGTHQQNVDDCTSQLRHTWGEKVGNAKLTAGQVHKIRDSPGTTAEIASSFGVNPRTVNQIRARQRWANLPELGPRHMATSD
ncbi:HNH endonuclease signature motif containing protein [Arthrobacter sp. PsM3]|uniref:HNH endonuclease signature motif containing protein n=1 Tax=Arthrobacter sp. PsM3 TaxID=3030531 RepID=UPI00345F3B05